MKLATSRLKEIIREEIRESILESVPPGLATTADMPPVAVPAEDTGGFIAKFKNAIVAIANAIGKGLSPSPEYMESLELLRQTNPELYEKVLNDLAEGGGVLRPGMFEENIERIISEEIAAIGEDVQYKSTHSRASREHGKIGSALRDPYGPSTPRGSDEKPFQEKDRVEKAGYGEGTVHSVWKHPKGIWVVDVNWDSGAKKDTHSAGTLNLVK